MLGRQLLRPPRLARRSCMRFGLLFALVAFAVVPCLADTGDPARVIVADDVVVTAPAPATITAGDRAVIDDVLGDVVDAATNHTNLSLLVVFSLAIAALLKLSKLGLLARFLEARHITWVRPILAVVLGALGSLAAALQQGRTAAGDLLSAAIGGALAGLVGVGSYEVARLASPDERAKKRVDEDALAVVAGVAENAAVGAQADAGKHVTAARAAVAHTVNLSPAKRVEALAAMLRRAPR